MLNKIRDKIFDYIEFIFIYFKILILGKYYSVKTLQSCRERNIAKILRLFNAKVGINNNFKGNLIIDNHKGDLSNITIGDKCYIGKNISLDLANKIIVEDEVVISMGVTILTHEDVGDRLLSKFYKRKSKPVILEKGCWIGANSTILTGVKIGKCAVVAAGSVVIDDIPAGAVVAGVPAQVKKINKDIS